jgi:hypothetical protein
MRVLAAVLALALPACATSSGRAPPPARAAASEPARKAGEPEIVHTGKARKLTLGQATERYERKGNRCAGADAPEQVIGEPDQRNEMQQGRDKVVTYGYRFAEGTLMIRCRADHVETTRRLK